MSTKTTTTSRPDELSRYRQVENFRPGWWWLGTYRDGADGPEYSMWTQAGVIMLGEQVGTGRKTVRVLGTCLDGEPGELHVYRGTQFLTLTERDGKRCGLAVAEPGTDHEEDTT